MDTTKQTERLHHDHSTVYSTFLPFDVGKVNLSDLPIYFQSTLLIIYSLLMASFFPIETGFLPIWLLFTSSAGIFMTFACYTSPEMGRRLYQGPAARTQVTGLSSRLFGIWTLLSIVVRTYAAFNLANREVYAIALSTYIIVSGFFLSEWLVYKTVVLGREIAPTFVVATVSLIWMITQWEYYVKA